MDKSSSFTAGCVELGPLATLSIQRTQPGVTPEAPNNEDRARAFRNAQPVALANNFEWPFQRIVGGQQAVARLVVANEAKADAAKSGGNAGVRWLTPTHVLHGYVAGRSQRSDMHDRLASILPISEALTGTTR
ncbi:MAG TPA: hypothetical protein VIT22_06625 [Pseudoxanthomonas sp.]